MTVPSYLMPYLPTFGSARFGEISNNCGLVVDPVDRQATQHEIEFFAEQLIRSVIDTISNRPSDNTTQDIVAHVVKEFNIKM